MDSSPNSLPVRATPPAEINADPRAAVPPPRRVGLGAAWIFVSILLAAFAQPLLSLFTYAAGTELHSHLILIPFVTAYLIYIGKEKLPKRLDSSFALAVLPLTMGLAALGLNWHLGASGASLRLNDSLALNAFAFVCFVWVGGFLFLGRRWMAAAAFPAAFLIFLVPLPDAIVDAVERASVIGSAEAAHLFFEMTGTPVLRDSMVFQLPGITLRVAQECSGIRSSWVLFITSLVASHLFLKSPWRRVFLVAFVIPLGLVRNGFRILVLGLLCVHVGPHMIDSIVHKRGGPLFFAVSLIPLFFLLWWLRRGESRRAPAIASKATLSN